MCKQLHCHWQIGSELSKYNRATYVSNNKIEDCRTVQGQGFDWLVKRGGIQVMVEGLLLIRDVKARVEIESFLKKPNFVHGRKSAKDHVYHRFGYEKSRLIPQ